MVDSVDPRPAVPRRVLATLEAHRLRQPEHDTAHHMAGRMGELRGHALNLARRAGPLGRDVMLILADYAEEAAVEFRAVEEPELSNAFTEAAETLRQDAQRFPAP